MGATTYHHERLIEYIEDCLWCTIWQLLKKWTIFEMTPDEPSNTALTLEMSTSDVLVLQAILYIIFTDMWSVNLGAR